MLVSPAEVEGPLLGQVVHRGVVRGLRTWVALSRRSLRGRGVRFAALLAAKSAARHGELTFRLGSGGRFTVDASDPYWVLPLLVDGAYERDLDWFLTRALRAGDTFLDCGANSGVWSIAASQVIDDASRVVAVEAGTTAFGRLSRNLAKNPGRFTTRHRAISTVGGETVEFFSHDADTASASLVRSLASAGARSEKVRTVALGDLLPAHDGTTLTFMKLDIEGMEEAVLSSLPVSAFDDVILAYEDHGRDLTSATTAMLLGRGFAVWLLLDDGRAVPVRDAGELRAHKTDPLRGYNLVAARPASPGAARVSSVVGDGCSIS